jgi:small subunit ribosomal protein S20
MDLSSWVKVKNFCSIRIVMANTASAIKNARQNPVRQARNRARVSRLRTYIKQVETAIESGNRAAAEEAFKIAQPIIHGSVNEGFLHRNTAARKLSRLTARIRLLAA